MEHGKTTGANVHRIVAFTYADAAERTAAVTSDFTVEDIDKVAKQLDDGSRWTLDSISPVVVWSPLGGGASLAVQKNGTPISTAPVATLNIVAPGSVGVVETGIGFISITLNGSGVWSLAGNLGSDEVTPEEIYPGPGIKFIPDLAPALGIGLVDTNMVLAIRMSLTHGLTQTSTKQIPANAVVHGCLVNITTPFTAGTTLEVGRAGALFLLQGTADNDTSTIDIYNAVQDTDWGGADEAVVVTLANGGAIVAGAGFVTVLYSVPSV